MQPDQVHRPLWAEINLDHLTHNLMEIRNQIQSGTAICAVLKANAYGHGSVVLARELEHIGVEHVAVATLNEAMELRQHGCHLPILVLGYTPVEKASLAIDLGIKQTIYTLEQAKSFSLAAEKLKKTACLHIKIDTGMSRLGFQPIQQSVDEIVEMVGYPWLQIEGIYTHYATADEADKSETMKQLDKYHWMIEALDARNCSFSIKHTANSAGIIDLPQTHFDMVRAGVMMYGLYPSEEVSHTDTTLKRVLSLKTRVAHVKEIAPGTGVSYGLTYRAARPTVIATLPVGYADGFTRLLSGRAEVSIQGKKVPVVGRICMDQCMVDITGMDVKQGDEVILYALTSEKGDTVDDVARKLGTINYEITCMVSRRVPRVYLRKGKIVEVWDPLLAD